MAKFPLRCPCCDQPLDLTPARWCADCDRPIMRGHKWRFNKKGRMVHRHCKYPTSYVTPEEYRKTHGEAAYQRMAQHILKNP